MDSDLNSELPDDEQGVPSRHALGDRDAAPTVESNQRSPKPDPSDLSVDEPTVASSDAPPERIGRYRISRLLGKGGFGRVYLGFDEQLNRRVAIKIPHASQIDGEVDIKLSLEEASMVANLDHPHIVPVLDIGSAPSYPFYVISKYVDGMSLAAHIKQKRLTCVDAAQLVATVADALHYAHKQGLVHRDVKPGNILIATDGTPFVVDFGLALREENVGKGPKYAGTPSYMSPEQARGEGHRVDGRSDVFSLGVVLYLLLTGRRPFRGDTQAELLEQVTTHDPRPLRQYDETLPKELERICFKSMAKRAIERYSSAHDFADDLRQFLAEQSPLGTSAPPTSQSEEDSPSPVSSGHSNEISTSSVGTLPSEAEAIRIVPKGLRAFGAHDADFFLELLPGPRDRRGLPDSLRFWITRIEESDADETFSIGLIYGPSGCGKSSLVRAGLIPRLPDRVIVVYVEATPDETEARLLHGLRKHCPELKADLDLKDSLASLRRGQFLGVNQKVLVIIDQFEQWLHTGLGAHATQLVDALRQCDGSRLQCIVMVRDDFWMAVTRFFRQLEVRLLEEQNIAAVDLFPERHAQNVLAAFGRAFGCIPEAGKIPAENKAFLKQAIRGLADEGKVICVRLALFAEMMKGKSWTPESLQAVGGTTGVGVTFLEETFSSSSASPEHRYHQQAARGVLNALLPDSGADIKGQMKSYQELLDASGYAARAEDFERLVEVLDNEIRLITPTDPEGTQSDEGETFSGKVAGEKYYQLTHDYLVPALRTWLTRKQRESRRGRAELCLAERSALWNSHRENRFLPSWMETAKIGLFTNKTEWTTSQRLMMDAARRVHGVRSALAAAMLAALIITGLLLNHAALDRQRSAEARRLVNGLLQADPSQVESILHDLEEYRDVAQEDLQDAFTQSAQDSNAKVHAGLALLAQDPSALPYLKDRLVTLSPAQFVSVSTLLLPYRDRIVADYWTMACDPRQDVDRRFRAACALARFDPGNDHWQDPEIVEFVSQHLVQVLPSRLLPWRTALQPVSRRLIPSLASIYRDEHRLDPARSFAADTLADYLSDDPDQLYSLLVDAEGQLYHIFFEKLVLHRDRAVELGVVGISEPPPANSSQSELESLARRKANAAIMLIKLEAPLAVWPWLRHQRDPRVRSYIVNRFAALRGDPQMIVSRYRSETDVSIQRALLLCLGGFESSELDSEDAQSLEDTLLDVYRNHQDAGMHSAAAWLLKRWGASEDIAAVDRELASHDWTQSSENRGWFVNGQGQTFAIFDVDHFTMGKGEANEDIAGLIFKHERRIARRFALATAEITKAQWREFSAGRSVVQADSEAVAKHVRSDDSPMGGISWYDACRYCNWLSEQEGIPEDQWCYVPNEAGEYSHGMKAKDRFWELAGYRIPTQSEWEYACRAGSALRRCYGDSEELLHHYAWYEMNSQQRSWPVGSLKPNDFGMFDMHGNVWEWCYDAIDDYPKNADSIATDEPATKVIVATDRRVIRGGAFLNTSGYVQTSYALHYLADYRSNLAGLRIAVTMDR